MTSNFQQQQLVWHSAACRSVPQPQHGQRAEKGPPSKPDKSAPKRRPAH